MPSTLFKLAFQGLREDFCPTIDVESGLYNLLLDYKILTREQRDLCRAEKTHQQQATKLLDILSNCDDKYFEPFCNCLKKIGQAFLSDELKKNLKAQQQMIFEEQNAANVNQVTASTQGTSAAEQHGLKYLNEDIDTFFSTMTMTKPEFYKKWQNQAYPMSSESRGTVLIFNIYGVAGMPRREGTKVDCDDLEKLFEKLHFTVEVFSDYTNGKPVPAALQPTARKIKHFIKETLETAAHGAQCFVLIILTHGKEIKNETGADDVIYGSDGEPVLKTELLDLLSDDQCPELTGKPRLIFFESCRGDDVLTREARNCSDIRKDTLYCHSCTAGHASLRHPQLGSRFIRALVRVFIDHAHNTDIVVLMDKIEIFMKDMEPDRSAGQLPEWYYDPKMKEQKRLFFFPGITEH